MFMETNLNKTQKARAMKKKTLHVPFGISTYSPKCFALINGLVTHRFNKKKCKMLFFNGTSPIFLFSRKSY